MQEAIRRVRAGEAEGIVVSKLDRLTRSVADLNALIAEYEAALTLKAMADTQGWERKTRKLTTAISSLAWGSCLPPLRRCLVQLPPQVSPGRLKGKTVSTGSRWGSKGGSAC
jgi:tRNA U55 pseudouridine synthase TruB